MCCPLHAACWGISNQRSAVCCGYRLEGQQQHWISRNCLQDVAGYGEKCIGERIDDAFIRLIAHVQVAAGNRHRHTALFNQTAIPKCFEKVVILPVLALVLLPFPCTGVLSVQLEFAAATACHPSSRSRQPNMLLSRHTSIPGQAQQHRRGLAAFQQGSSAAAPRPLSGGSRAAPAVPQRSRQQVVRARGDDEEPDWDKEMSIFKQRTM